MAEAFDEEEREDLFERGFNNEQIEYLESLEIEGIYFDICKIMDDFDDTAEEIVERYREANNDNNPQQYAALQGGRRRRNKKSRKGRSRKNKRSRKSRSMKNKRSRKSRRNKR
jgi:hypothetical protein